MPSPFTLILSYYCQPRMLERQLVELNQYPPGVQVIIVDDCSPEPAQPVVLECASAALLAHLRLYRILVDIPWNRGMARNLGAVETQTDWLLQTDLDHILPAPCVPAVLHFQPAAGTWYRFPRWRRGAADETRQKDTLSRECEYGQIKPHIDSYLIHRQLFLNSPYDESYSGCLGGGSPFLARMEQRAPVVLLPEEMRLEVYTRQRIPDASITTLSRDTSEYTRRRRQKEGSGDTKPTHILRQPWERVL
jgi:hypothetical protein